MAEQLLRPEVRVTVEVPPALQSDALAGVFIFGVLAGLVALLVLHSVFGRRA